VFLPALFDATISEIATLRPLLALPVRQGGLGIPDPTTTGAACFLASNEITSLLQESLINGEPLCAQEHRRTAANSRQDAKIRQKESKEDALATILQNAPPLVKRRIKRSKSTGAWLTTLPNRLNGSDLSAEEFRDGLRLRYGLSPTAMPPPNVTVVVKDSPQNMLCLAEKEV
jgi:hypothetical protein